MKNNNNINIWKIIIIECLMIKLKSLWSEKWDQSLSNNKDTSFLEQFYTNENRIEFGLIIECKSHPKAILLT